MGPYALFQAEPPRQRHPPAAVLAQHGDPAVHLRLIKTGGWLNGDVAGAAARPRPRLGVGAWDMNWDLIDKHGFNPNIYGAWNTGGNNRALQYVIDGLKLQGCGPGLVVARAAIIAGADELSDGAGHVHGVGDVRPPRPRLQRRAGHDRTATTTPRRSTRIRTAAAASQPRSPMPYGTL